MHLNFFDLTNGEPVSNWSIDGGYFAEENDWDVGNDKHWQDMRVPLAIADGDKRYAGIVLSIDRKKELFVLDYEAETVTEVQRIASGELVLVEDLNDDGKTDGLFFNERGLVTIELATGKEILRNPLAGIDIINIQSDADSGFLRIETETNDGSNRLLYLVDPATLEFQWEIPIPTFVGKKICGETTALLCGKNPKKPSDKALAPRVLFTRVIVEARAAQFKGDTHSFASGPRLSNSLTAASFVDSSDDPRLIEPLPWNFYGNGPRLSNSLTAASFFDSSDDPRLIEPLPWNFYGNAMGMFEIGRLDHGPVALLTQLFPIVIGVIVFPVGFVYTMIRRRRWSLQWFLLLPLIFVLPYILLQMPSELGAEYGYSSLPAWQVKLWSAFILLPFLIFIGVFARSVWQGRWKLLFWLTVLSLAVPVFMAVQEVWSTPLFEGGRFDWMDPGSLWLLWAAVWLGGVGIAVLWPLAFVGKMVLRLFGALSLIRSR